MEVPVSDAIGRHVSSYNAKRDIEGCISIARHIRRLKEERARPKPTKPSATIVKQLLGSVEKTMRLLEEIDLATDVRGEFNQALKYLEFENAAHDLCFGVTDKYGSESVHVDYDFSNADETAEFPVVFLELLSKDDLAKFHRIVDSHKCTRKRDFDMTLQFVKRALEMVDKTEPAGKGRKRDKALDTFLWLTASSIHAFWREDCQISDVPSSPFFKLVDELASLGGVQLADRTLRERIERMILETRADKWCEKG